MFNPFKKKKRRKQSVINPQDNAATLIAARLRGRALRKSMDRQHAAAIAVQKRVRGMAGRAVAGVKAAISTTGEGIMFVARGSLAIAQAGLTVVQDAASGAKDHPRATKAQVDARTHADRWFTPTGGWEQNPVGGWEERGAPPHLVPTAAEEPCLFPELLGKGSEEVLGELRVEILEAERLPKMDGVGTCDPYAVVVFEGCAARTLAVRGKASDRQRPRWGSEAARAFRFPVRCPYSCLYVALKDADDLLGNDGLDPDDDIGRVTLPLSL